tara:strand:- start:1191 stop:1655 length:465 start_codon:yes stop_codon:yes gene_type:complete
MFKKFVIQFFSLLLLLNCGFKVSYENIDRDFKILNITDNGDKALNLRIKNNLILNNTSDNLINVELNTNKRKLIKEKNISNKIVKQEIKINVLVNYSVVGKDKEGQFIVLKDGSYEVNERHFRTKENERKLINSLVKEVANEILRKISKELNDI